MEKYKLIFFVFFLNLCCSSFQKHEEITTIKCNKSIFQLNDSTYIQEITSIDGNDNFLYLAESKNNRILRLTNSMLFDTKIGNTGLGPGEFVGISAIYLTDVFLYATSRGAGKINKFTLGGKYIDSISFPSRFMNTKFTVDKQNNIYVSHPESGYLISKIDSSGRIIKSFGEMFKSKYPEQIYSINQGHLCKWSY